MADNTPHWLHAAHRWRPPTMAYVFVICFVLDILFVPGAAKVNNLANVSQDSSILLFAALGQALALITAGLDLSSGAAVGLLSVIVLQTAASGHEILAVVAGFVVAFAVGAVNGAVIGGIRVPPLLVTLGTMTACTGLASIFSGGAPIFSHTALLGAGLVYGSILGIPNVAFAALALCLILWFVLNRTAYGRHLYATGASVRVSRYSGLHIGRTLFLVYLFAALCAGAAGFLLTVRIGTGTANLNPSLAFDAIAACAIGGIPLSGGRGRISQVVFGVLLLSLLKNAVILLNFDSSWQLVLTGVVIIGAVLAQRNEGSLSHLTRRPTSGARQSLDDLIAGEREGDAA